MSGRELGECFLALALYVRKATATMKEKPKMETRMATAVAVFILEFEM